ncbi:hypothetical protein BC941DRAFT_399684 [Chlamydoabsidia padenii]|nr:hypothetical protein BC941DRAFT_399684 [Chlamydoabsidia padenii]
MTPESMDEFKQIYSKMEDSMKWKLECTGRYVEDVLYNHGLTLEKENCLHSFILDTDDDDIRGLFGRDEWEEIDCTNVKEDPPLPDNVKTLLHDLNKTDYSAIYDILKDSTRRYEDFNTKAIFYAVDSILFLYEAVPNPLMSQQLEQWYQANIWTPIMDKMLGDLPGVVCVLGESASLASKERKRQQGKLPSGRMGSRTDITLRKAGNGLVLEYGAAEDAANYDGTLGKKRMHEAELKLPKTLKDMMTVLCNDCNWNAAIIKNIEVVGYCHSGTVTEFMVMDNPSGYVCRLLRSNYYQVPDTIADISKLLRLLAAALRMKLRVSRSIDSINKLYLDLDSTKMKARKRKASKSVADTLTTPPRPTTSYQKRKKNPYLYD